MKRRNFLALVGGGVILAAGTTMGVVATRVPDKALQPWEKAGGPQYSDPRMRALSYAILAPNPHNRQPWLVDLSVDDHITLTVDTNKLLPHTDPFSRQITIGLGCFLEVLRMAAAQEGYRAELDLFPEGSDVTALDQRPVANIKITKDDAILPDPLFAHLPDRRSLKEAFDTTKPVTSDTLAQIQNAAIYSTMGINNQTAQRDKLRQITHNAFDIELDTPHTYKESVDLYRIGKTEIEANPDGIDLSGPLFESLHFTGILTRENAISPDSTFFKGGKTMGSDQANTAMAHLWLISPSNNRVDQIKTGADWVRTNLATTGLGVSLHPMSQALQEYPEMKSIYDETQKLLAPDGGTVQMLGRLGYAARVAPSPRWPIEAKIIKA